MMFSKVTRAFIIFTLSLLCAAVHAQSGGGSGSTAARPTTPPPLASPSPVKSKANPGKSSLPKEINGERVYTSKEVDEQFKILKKPVPGYTVVARMNKIQGDIILRVILASDETVKHIEVIEELPDGLSENAVAAARKIKFKPAMKDGKPVSAWAEVKYNFRLD